MKRRAERGQHTGGRVFGYDNVCSVCERVIPPGTRRCCSGGHTQRRINDTEADVVRRIFVMCVAGTGYTRISKLLNSDGAVRPRPQRGRPAGWSPSTVRDVLHRDLYRGVHIWNQSKKRDKTGAVSPHPRPESEWLRTAREDLRIVTDAQWETAHVRLARTRVTLTTALGQRALVQRDYESKYLLTGFGRCGTCGGAFAALSRSHGRSRRFVYGCLSHAKRGRAVCPNDVILPLDRVDDAVLKALGGDVLRPAVVSAILDTVFEQLLPTNVESRVQDLRRALRAVETKIGHLTAAIEPGGPLASLVAVLAERQAERDAVRAELGSAETVHQIQVDRAAIEAKVQDAVANWRQLLTGSVPEGRQLLRDVLTAPLRFTPGPGRTYRFSGPVATGALIAGR